jgi:hypothetical protein
MIEIYDEISGKVILVKNFQLQKYLKDARTNLKETK